MNVDWTPILSFLSGGLVTAFVGHFLTVSKESRDRRHAFRGFLGRWKARTAQDADRSEFALPY